MAEECLFCAIASGKVPSKKVYEDDVSFAFLDINPRNPGHTLVIPKKHFDTIMEMDDSLIGKLFEAVKKVSCMVKNGTKADGISIAQSNGKAAGQLVSHAHFHVIPRFENEGPVGLEGILPIKKLDDASMLKIAGTIKDASTKATKVKQVDLEKEEEDESMDKEIEKNLRELEI